MQASTEELQSSGEEPQRHDATMTAITTLSSPPGDPPSYEAINMHEHLMHFAEANTLQPRNYAVLTRHGIVAHGPWEPTSRMVSAGAELLDRILNVIQEIGEYLLDMDNLMGCSAAGPLRMIAWRSSKHILRDLLHNRTKAKLEAMSQTFFLETSRTPTFPSSPTSFNEPWPRWELIGNSVAQIGVYLSGERDKRHRKGDLPDRKALMKEVFEICVECQPFCQPNDLTLWFLFIFVLFATW
jgi:hypothetical protein